MLVEGHGVVIQRDGLERRQVWRLRVWKEATLEYNAGRTREGVVGAVE